MKNKEWELLLSVFNALYFDKDRRFSFISKRQTYGTVDNKGKGVKQLWPGKEFESWMNKGRFIW